MHRTGRPNPTCYGTFRRRWRKSWTCPVARSGGERWWTARGCFWNTTPDHQTLWRFRRKQRPLMRWVFKQGVRLRRAEWLVALDRVRRQAKAGTGSKRTEKELRQGGEERDADMAQGDGRRLAGVRRTERRGVRICCRRRWRLWRGGRRRPGKTCGVGG